MERSLEAAQEQLKHMHFARHHMAGVVREKANELRAVSFQLLSCCTTPALAPTYKIALKTYCP